jgi:1-acyl-sn-glycerol-3-phosphate acyltransferase
MNTAYALLRQLLRLLLRVFYGRIDVVGLAHVPATGPLVIAANHSNGLIDSLLLLAILPRRLVPVAKASLVRHPVLGPVLRALGAIPVHRHQDGNADTRQNICAIAAAAARALQQQRAVLIFPEGVSQPDPLLTPLRRGAARMVLAVETARARPVGVTVLCIGLLYRQAGTFGNARAVVRIGPPVPTAVAIAEFRRAPERAIRWLTELIGAGLRAEIAEAEDRQPTVISSRKDCDCGRTCSSAPPICAHQRC